LRTLKRVLLFAEKATHIVRGARRKSMNRVQAEEKSRRRLYLRENGCPVQPESHHGVLPPELAIIQVPLDMVNVVFDLESGAAAYILDADLTTNRARPIRFSGVQIRPPWEGSRISLLRDDLRYRTKGGFYQFPGAAGPYFEGSEVLNRLLSGKGRLNRPDGVEGLILAIDPHPIPADVSDRSRIVVKLTLFDGAGNGFSLNFRLFVFRSAVCARKRAEETHGYFESPPTRKRALVRS
jgi:hypothetical protein